MARAGHAHEERERREKQEAEGHASRVRPACGRSENDGDGDQVGQAERRDEQHGNADELQRLPPFARGGRKPTIRRVGTETRKDEEGRENDRNGVDRICEEEHEALNERDFEKHVRES
jgi:hypothetical protein